MRFVGFENYINLFMSETFQYSLKITLFFTFVTVGLEIIVALAIALALNQNFKGVGLLKGLLLVPWAIPPIVSGLMWRWLYNPAFGPLNGLLYLMGVIDKYQNWLGTWYSALICVMIARIWTRVPFSSIIFLAALTTIPSDIYDSAKVDGAGKWATFRYITLPMMKPIIALMMILETMFTLRTFDEIFAITGGGPGTSTTVLGWLLYQQAFVGLNFGLGSAISVILSLLTIVIALIYLRLAYRE